MDTKSVRVSSLVVFFVQLNGRKMCPVQKFLPKRTTFSVRFLGPLCEILTKRNLKLSVDAFSCRVLLTKTVQQLRSAAATLPH